MSSIYNSRFLNYFLSVSGTTKIPDIGLLSLGTTRTTVAPDPGHPGLLITTANLGVPEISSTDLGPLSDVTTMATDDPPPDPGQL